MLNDLAAGKVYTKDPVSINPEKFHYPDGGQLGVCRKVMSVSGRRNSQHNGRNSESLNDPEAAIVVCIRHQEYGFTLRCDRPVDNSL